MKVAAIVAIAVVPLAAQPDTADFFETKIRPVLATNCHGCHSSKMKSPMGELALDTKAGLQKGGASGPVIAPGEPGSSLLLRAIRYNDLKLKMPPINKLPDNVIANFEQWIAAGAVDPRREDGAPAASAKERTIDIEKRRQWWSFRPVEEIAEPKVRNAARVKTKIDSFVLASLERNGLAPSPEADPRTLVQRIYVDLTGLKPTYEQVQEYLNDNPPNRYENLIDRLLASPRYGERWARYWLDIARYGENADGLANRNQYFYAWRYRDWVIEALNQDVKYDRFVKLQLAADHMPDAARSDLRALGYLGAAPAEWKEFKLGKEMFQQLILDDLDERVDAVGRGILGLTVACARCHDHKFDPIPTKDYYALAGVFASTASTLRPLDAIDPAVEARYMWARQRLTDLSAVASTVGKSPGQNPELSKRKVAEYRAEIQKIKGEMLALREKYPELVASFGKLLDPEEKEKKETGGEEKPKPPDPKGPFINAVYDAGLWLDGSHPDVTLMEFRPGQPVDMPVYHRGSSSTPGREIVPRHFLSVLSKGEAEPFRRGSGRLDLAERIFTDGAPLAARVIVNRVWGWHFDKHLVATPSDLGDRGEKPTHPELLDDLASRFIRNGWSLKWLHREIMLSAAYRQSSKPRPEAEEKDAGNQWIWRMNPRRMDIEAYRDTLLNAVGLLNLKMYGPSTELEAPDNYRRSVYAKIPRGAMPELMRMFDFPTPFQTSPARIPTVTPLQQLFVMNSPMVEKLADTLAKSVEAEPDMAAKVRAIYRKALARDPSGEEINVALTYLNTAPLPRFAQLLLGTNEEIFWP